MTKAEICTLIRSLKTRLVYEKNLYNRGLRNIAGIDEVGRGSLAGPMVVSAVILDLQKLFNNIDMLEMLVLESAQLEMNNDVLLHLEKVEKINDSKKLSAKKRQTGAEFIKETAVKYSFFEIDNLTLDRIGLSQATQVGFFNALKGLDIEIDHVLTDQYRINALKSDKQTNVTRGDQLSITIGAASILAKTYRDEKLLRLHKDFPQYGFDKHKGYGTKKHIEQIKLLGACLHHRKNFEPIKSMKNGAKDQ